MPDPPGPSSDGAPLETLSYQETLERGDVEELAASLHGVRRGSLPTDPTQRALAGQPGAGMGPGTTINPADLPELSVTQPAGAPVLGQGGMGVVYLGTQEPLGRAVALKTLRHRPWDDESAAALIREACLMGHLEHPNVVPIHGLGRDAEGAPLLMMKRVEGVSWRALLRHADHPLWSRVPGDRLEWNLRVLIQVCNAIEFAHSQKVIHRDLKPDNVMIGSYGEVYVLDWGVALDLRRRPAPGSQARPSIFGTPAYMAPEMARGDPGLLDERSDVFLLGAVLHEVLTGQPRHLGTRVAETLLAAYQSRPMAYGPGVPAELAAIANRATDRDPALRYRSAESFREAIEGFVRDRSALSLCDDAGRRQGELRALLEAGRPSGAAPTDPTRIHRLLGAARSGYQSATKASPSRRIAEQAEAGVRDCLILVATFELSRQNLEGAEVLVAEVERPPAALLEELAALRTREQQQKRELEGLRRMRHEADPRVGARVRAWATVLLLAVLTGSIELARSLLGLSVVSPRGLVTAGTVIFLGVALAVVLLRKHLLANQASARLSYVLVSAFGGLVLHRLLGVLMEVPAKVILTWEHVIGGLVTATLSITSYRGMAWAAAWFWLSAFALARTGKAGDHLHLVAMAVGIGLVALAWGKAEARPEKD